MKKDPVTQSKLWIIEPDLIMRTFLERALLQMGQQITVFEDTFDARRALKKQRPDLVIMEMILEHGTSLDFCQVLKQHDPVVMILIISARQLLADRLACLRAGADLFLAKPYEPDELCAYVQSFLQKRQALRHTRLSDSAPPSQGLTCGPLRLNWDTQQAWVHQQEWLLSPVPFRLLWVLVQHANTPLTRQQLAAFIWSGQRSRSLRTIDQMMMRLRKDLKQIEGASSTFQIETLHRKGYRFSFACSEDAVGNSKPSLIS